MVEDTNDGEFLAPPPDGGARRPNAGPVGVGLFTYQLSDQSQRGARGGERGDAGGRRARRAGALPGAQRVARRVLRAPARRLPHGGVEGPRRGRPPLRGVRQRGPLLHRLLGDPDLARREPLPDDLGRRGASRRSDSYDAPRTSACPKRRRASAPDSSRARGTARSAMTGLRTATDRTADSANGPRTHRTTCYGEAVRRMSDDEPPRSKRPCGRDRAMNRSTASASSSPLIDGLNGFFVAAEYALVRSRRRPARAAASRRARKRRRARQEPDRADRRVPRRPASSASRWPRSASAASASPRSPHCSRTPLGERRSAHGAAVAISLAIIAYLDHHRAATSRSASRSPKIYTIVHAEGVGAARGAPARVLPASSSSPFIWLAQLGVATAILRPFGVRPERRVRGDHHLRGPEVADRAQRVAAASSTRARPGCCRASSTCTSRRRAR